VPDDFTFTEADFAKPATKDDFTFTEADFATPTTFASNLPIIPATPQDIAETAKMGIPSANIAKGFGFMGRGAIAGLADAGAVAMRPITDELFPEQAAPGPIGPPENIQALMANEPLPAKNLATLPKGLQFAGHAAQGLIETAPKIAGVTALQAAGVPTPIGAGMVFGATEDGFDPVQGAIAAALPLAGRISGGIAGKVAKVLGVDSPTAINWIKGIAGTAGPAAAIVAQGEHEIAKLPADQQDAARVQMWEGVAGQAALGPMGVKFEKTLLPRAKAAAEGVQTPPEGQTPAQPPTAARPTPATALHPEVQTLLDEVTSRTDHQVEIVKPDGSWKPLQIARPNRKTGKTEINADELNKHILEDTPPEKRAEAMNTLLTHEYIHLRTSEEDANKYTGTLTALEKWSERKLYGDPNISDTNLGYEAIRRRIEQLSGLDTSETLSLIGKERWKLKSLEALNSTVRGIRESMGTKASKEGLAILDRVTGNIEAGIIALGGTVQEPAATRTAQDEEQKAPGETTYAEMDKMSNSETLKYFDENFKKGNPPQKDAVIAGLKLGPEHVKELKDLSDKWGKKMIEAYGTMDEATAKPAYAKHVWYNAAIEGANRKGPNYDTYLERQTPGEDQPGARRQKKDEKQADLLLTERGQPAATAADLGAKPLVTPSFLTPDKINHEAKGGKAGFRTITDAEVKSPSVLAKIFGVRTGSKDENATKTRTVAVLRDNYTGRIEAVSTYPDAQRGIKMGDPSLLSDNAARPHRQMTDLLHRYTPLYAIRLKDPVQNFHERFASMQEFQDKFGSAASEDAAKLTGAAPQQNVAASAPGEIGQIDPPQDAEAGALHDFFKGKLPATPEDMRSALSKGTANRQMISALRQMMEHEQARNPNLTAAEALENTLTKTYDDLTQSKTRDDFTQRILGRFAEPIARTNEPVGPATAQAEQKPAGAGQTFAPPGAPTEVTPPKAEPAAMRHLKRNLQDEAAEATAAFTAIIQRHDVATEVARGVDSVENKSNNLSSQAEWDVRLRAIQKPTGVLTQKLTGWRRGNKEILSAAKVLVESSFDKTKLPDYQKLLDDAKAIGEREVATGQWSLRRQGEARLREVKNLQDALTYAEAHWDDPDLQATAKKGTENFQHIYDQEKAAGYDLTKDPNYLPHRYVSGLRIGQKTFVMGKRFREPKSFDTLFQAIADPTDLYVSATHDLASLVGHRARQSLNMINKDAWLESLKAMDVPNGQKLALAPKMGAHGLVSPDANYRLVEVRPGKTLAIHQDFADGIQNLTAPDWIEGWGPTRGLLHAEQMLKHSLLVGDFFHLSRMGYYGASILGRKFGWKGGWTVLDIQSKNIPEAIKRGIITEKDAQWGREQVKFGNQQVSRRWLVEKFYKEMGSNLGKVQDALYKDLITDMTAASPNWRRGLARVADPTVGRYNRFLFDKLTRGLMAESVAREFERQSQAKPEANPEALMKDIARDTNNFYGNIGRQGWFKSAGMRSFMRLFALAPQWVEGLAKKEAIAYSRLSGASSLAGKRQGLTALGTTGSAVGKGMLFMAGLTQAINLITRGHPTWMNEEKEHKLDAWIPAWGSNKEGFWLSPLAIFNEITHDLYRLTMSKPTFAEAAAQIAGNKESPILRAAIIMGTGKTPQGEQTTGTMERIGEAAKATVPMPISFGRFAQAGAHKIAPGIVPATAPGQTQRQFFGVGGIKIEPGLTQAAKMSHMAKDFMQKEGLQKDTGWIEVQTTSPSYSKLRQALRNGDSSKAARLLNSLRKQHTDGEILKAMKIDAKRPFTGSLKNEKRFLGSMDDKQMEEYFQATDAKLADYEKFIDWYLDQPQPQP
jgi:hypothetical protein